MRTEGLPKIFEELEEKFELTVAPKGEGTEVVVGIDDERGVLHFFCRGKHEKRYKVRLKDGVKEAEPYEGVVTINSESFGDLYLVMMGLKENSGDLGIDSSNRIKAMYHQETRNVSISFTNYKNVQRTIISFSGYKLVLMRAIFEMLKRKIPVIEFTHVENDVVVKTEFDRLGNTLTISHNYGKVVLEDKTVFAVRELIGNLFIFGTEMTRDFRVGVKGAFSLKPDGTIFVAGRNVSKKTAKILLCGEEREVKAYPLMLWKVTS